MIRRKKEREELIKEAHLTYIDVVRGFLKKSRSNPEGYSWERCYSRDKK